MDARVSVEEYSPVAEHVLEDPAAASAQLRAQCPVPRGEVMDRTL
jgi:hypothetical protein